MYKPEHPVRFVTSSALFDGHDASINIMRRILQSQGAEVVHLGHNRAVSEIVAAALEEDVQGVAVSSYQGGHVEYFEYLVESLREQGAGHVKVFGGGGGVIVPEEIARLRESGVTIFSPEDGQRLGLAGMINQIVEACDHDLWDVAPADPEAVLAGHRDAIARAITGAESGRLDDALRQAIHDAAEASHVPLLGITGTGGSGKSSLTDELVRRFRTDQQDKLRIAVLAIDPTRRKGGGALLGDRIRMNALDGDRIYFRSLATRGGHEHPDHLDDVIAVLKASGFDLVIIETPGIGQGDAGIVPFVDRSMYVMTPEFGAPSQLEKIDMLDFADVVAINKFERRGAKDALRDVGRQLVRNREAFDQKPEDMPVFGTSAATFNDDGVTALYHHVARMLREDGLAMEDGVLPAVDTKVSTGFAAVVPPERVRYLSEIAETVRDYHADTERLAEQARRRAAARGRRRGARRTTTSPACSTRPARSCRTRVAEQIEGWPDVVESYSGDEQVVVVRDQEIHTTLRRESLSGSKIPRVSLPRYHDHGDLVSFLRRENLPGFFPFTAGVFRFKRDTEDAARMFAGEGDAFRTNRRFKLLSQDGEADRLSTAFDSVTLYGRDPDLRPDVYGKVGTSGVSIATLDDMKALYDGFDLLSPSTSVSMTINGPAPTVLAFFLNTAIDQGARPRASSPAEHRCQRVRRHRAGRHPQGGPGPEHLPVLHRVQPADDGRHPGVVHRAPGAQLLLGVDLRLPHRRGRGEPHQPARVHPRQRVHVRRGLPRARHGHRRLRAQPVVLLLQRHGPGVLGARPGRPAHLGDHDARPLRRQRAQPEAQVPRPDVRTLAARAGDELQRHPHHAAGAHRHLRQREQPAHQRLRRGRHHPEQRVSAPRARDPA